MQICNRFESWKSFKLSPPVLGNCSCCLSSADFFFFFKLNFYEKLFQEYHQSVKHFGPRSGPTFCRADLGKYKGSEIDCLSGAIIKTICSWTCMYREAS